MKLSYAASDFFVIEISEILGGWHITLRDYCWRLTWHGTAHIAEEKIYSKIIVVKQARNKTGLAAE